MELSIDRSADCRTGIVGNGWHKDVRKDAGFPPLRVPVAVQAATSGDDERQTFAQVHLCKTVEGLEDSVAKQASERREMLEPRRALCFKEDVWQFGLLALDEQRQHRSSPQFHLIPVEQVPNGPHVNGPEPFRLAVKVTPFLLHVEFWSQVTSHSGLEGVS